MRCFLSVLALTLVVGCSRRQPEKGTTGADGPNLRIAVVTDLKGYLGPCGCTSDPLGGIDRLAAQIRELRKESTPLLLLLAGDTFFDAAELEPVRVDQANRNAQTLGEVLNRLEVAALVLGPSDRGQPRDAVAKLRAASGFPWLATSASTEFLELDAGELRVEVVGVRPGAARSAVEAAIGASDSRADLRILLVHGSRRDANRLAAIGGVDFVVHGGLDEDDPLPPHQSGEAWLLHASRQGQGLTVVDVFRKRQDATFVDLSEWSRTERAAQIDKQLGDLAKKIEAWERSADVDAADLRVQRERLAEMKTERASLDDPEPEKNSNAFSARWIRLSKKTPSDPEVEKLMRAHDKVVNDANRAAFADLKPAPLGPEDIAYIGSAACSGCHQTAYSWWVNHAHGVAYLTLQQRSKEFNLDCVGCHVTGYQQPGGSTVTHNLDGGLLNVGCESCHGPGAAHAKDPEKAGIVRDTPESTCVQCHNTQHSDLFDYEAYKRTLVVQGHGLPPFVR